MTDGLRIALIGQAAFGESVLNALTERGEHVVGAFCAPDRAGKAPDPAKVAAQEQGVPVFQFPRLRDGKAIEAFKGLEADLGVMAFVTDLVPKAILGAPRHGTIQYHPSLLPKHRGPSSINWPIIQGETRTGLSIFWPDEGLDTGPLLLQKEVAIAPDDTLGSLYFGKLFPLGVEAMLEAIDLVKKGTAPRIVQDESRATYEGWCGAADVVVDWERPIDEVYNLIRGADPSPGANSLVDGETVKFFKASKRGGENSGAPGAVVEVADAGFAVAAKGGSVFIGRVQPKGSGKISGGEWAAASGLKPGARLGS